MNAALPLLAILLANPLSLASPLSSASCPVAQNHDRRGSPFEELRWKDGEPEARIGDVWYRPVSIHDVEVSRILGFCAMRWPGQQQKRFGEDLVEAMVLMGYPPPEKVDLELVRLEDDTPVTLKGVVMSEENRNAIRDAGRGDRPRMLLAKPLSRREAEADIDAFAAGLRDGFAYLELRGIDLDRELDDVRASLRDEVPVDWLASRLDRVLVRFGDGHASASVRGAAGPRAYPPALLFECAGGVVATHPDRSGFLDPERPFVATLDGEPLEAWIEAAGAYEVDGSPQLVQHRSLRGLRALETLRRDRGLEEQRTVRYGLCAAPGSDDVRVVELAMSPRRPTYGPWPRTETGLLDGNIGYLRLDRMSDKLIPGLHQAMSEFRDTQGLIVDVRGNGGGSRGLLLALAGYLIGPDEGPWIGNIAAYRKSARFDADHLEARFMWRAGSDRWNDAQRAAIEAAAAGFDPEWELQDGFSEWHYLVLDRTGADGEFFYDKPVIVLADAGCFSATDIFLGALIGHPRVTLMGSASGGGSARSQSFELPASGIRVRCASMASFRPDGRLYDGRGVEVDVPVETLPTDVLVGGTDRVLEAALQELGAR